MKMKKRFRKLMSVMMVSALLICMTNGLQLNMLTAKAETYSGAFGTNLQWSLDTSTGVLTITGSGDAPVYSNANSDPWRSYNSQITSVVISEGVTSLGKYTFCNMSSLTSISLPASLVSISTDYNRPFMDCVNITSITVDSANTTFDSRDNCNAVIKKSDNALVIGCKSTVIPNSVTIIEGNAFQSCRSLTGNLIIPEGVTSIGSSAFTNCSGLTGIELPDSVTYIGSSAFQSCSSLTGNLIIPGSVQSISSGAFSNCSSLTNLTLESGIQSIQSNAFSGCSALTGTVTIPASVTSISENPFYSCGALTGFVVESGNTVYDSRNDCNAIIKTSNNQLISGCQNTIIPDSVRSIGARAFYQCRGLTSIDIPEGVTSIGTYAFYSCTNLTGSLVIPNTVTSIGTNAFYNCNSITGLTIGNSVRTIGSEAFYNCSSITGTLTIPNSVTSIGTYAFRGCSGLTGSLVIPNGVTSISSYAFQNCSGLTGVEIPNNVTSIATYAFDGCSGLTGSLVIPNRVTSIGAYAFRGCSGLTELTIGSGVSTIGSYAFATCGGLTNLEIPAGVTNIATYAFYNCNNIDKIIMYPQAGTCAIGNSASVFPSQAVIYCYANSSADSYADLYNRPKGRIETPDGTWKANWETTGMTGWQFYSSNGDRVFYRGGTTMEDTPTYILEKTTFDEYDFQVKTPAFTAENSGKYKITFNNLENGNTQISYIEVYKNNDEMIAKTEAKAVNEGSVTSYKLEVNLTAGDTIYVKYVESYASVGSKQMSVIIQEPETTARESSLCVEGFQIRTNDTDNDSVAYRTVCKAPKKGSVVRINGVTYTVADFGTVYAIDPDNRTGRNENNNIDSAYTILDEENIVNGQQWRYIGKNKYKQNNLAYGYVATDKAILGTWNSSDKDHTYYATTMQGMNEGMGNTLFVRAFIVTTDHKIIYTPKTAVTSVAQIADYLYQNSYSKNYTAHTYLYNNILHSQTLKDNNNIYYRDNDETVEYGWSDNLYQQEKWTLIPEADHPGWTKVGVWYLFSETGYGSTYYSGNGETPGDMKIKMESDNGGEISNGLRTSYHMEQGKTYDYTIRFTSTNEGMARMAMSYQAGAPLYLDSNIVKGENIRTGTLTCNVDGNFDFQFFTNGSSPLPSGTIIDFEEVTITEWTPVTAKEKTDSSSPVYTPGNIEPDEVGFWNLYAAQGNGAMSYCGNGDTIDDMKIKIDEQGDLCAETFYYMATGKKYDYTIEFTSTHTGTVQILLGYRNGEPLTLTHNVTEGRNIVTGMIACEDGGTYSCYFVPQTLPVGCVIDFVDLQLGEHWEPVTQRAKADSTKPVYEPGNSTPDTVGIWRLYATENNGEMSYAGNGTTFDDIKIRVDWQGDICAETTYEMVENITYNYVIRFRASQEGTARILLGYRNGAPQTVNVNVSVGENRVTGFVSCKATDTYFFRFVPQNLPAGTIIEFEELTVTEQDWTEVMPIECGPFTSRDSSAVAKETDSATIVGEWQLYVQQGNGAMSYKGAGETFDDLKIRVDAPSSRVGMSSYNLTGLAIRNNFRYSMVNGKTYQYTFRFKSTNPGTMYAKLGYRQGAPQQICPAVTAGENVITGTVTCTYTNNYTFAIDILNFPVGTILEFEELTVTQVS